MNRDNFHRYDRMVELELAKLENNTFLGDNALLIQEFYVHLSSIGTSKPRIAKYLITLRSLEKLLQKPFKTATKADIVKLVTVIQDKDYSVWTKRDFKIILKAFYKWLSKSEEYPDLVRWIKPNVKRKDQPALSDGDLLSEDEVKLMVNQCDNTRDKAIISILYKSGARIGEIGTLQLKNVNFDKYGVILNVNGKTGPRKVRIISSTHYLMSWLESHPSRKDRESPLWTNFSGDKHKMMNYYSISKMLRKTAKNVGITKRVHPHLFRHSRATKLADNLTEFQMNQYFGWIQGSNMPSTYVHMSGKQIDDALLQMHGFTQEEEKQPEAKKCPRCNHINPATVQNCIRCVSYLDQKAVFEQEEYEKKKIEIDGQSEKLLKLIMADPEVQQRAIKVLQDTGHVGEMLKLTL